MIEVEFRHQEDEVLHASVGEGRFYSLQDMWTSLAAQCTQYDTDTLESSLPTTHDLSEAETHHLCSVILLDREFLHSYYRRTPYLCVGVVLKEFKLRVLYHRGLDVETAIAYEYDYVALLRAHGESGRGTPQDFALRAWFLLWYVHTSVATFLESQLGLVNGCTKLYGSHQVVASIHASINTSIRWRGSSS